MKSCSDQQIAFVLRQADEGTAFTEVCRKWGSMRRSSATLQSPSPRSSPPIYRGVVPRWRPASASHDPPVTQSSPHRERESI